MESREQETGRREAGVQYALQGHIPNGPASSYMPNLLKVPSASNRTSSLQHRPLEDSRVKP